MTRGPDRQSETIARRCMASVTLSKMTHEIFMAVMGRIILVRRNPIRTSNNIYCRGRAADLPVWGGGDDDRDERLNQSE